MVVRMALLTKTERLHARQARNAAAPGACGSHDFATHKTIAARPGRRSVNHAADTSGRALRGHHDADEVGGVPGAELLHDVGAVILNSPRADTERAAGFLVRGAAGELLQDFAFAPRQWFTPWEMIRGGFR